MMNFNIEEHLPLLTSLHGLIFKPKDQDFISSSSDASNNQDLK